MTISRRAVMLGGLGLAALPSAARAGVLCSPFDYRGIQRCDAGLQISLSRAASGATFQQKQNWCWAACIAAVFGYRGYSISQAEIVEKVFGDDLDQPAAGPQIIGAIDGAWTDQNGQEFYAQGVVLLDGQYSIAHPQALAIAAQELAAEHPLIVGSMGHAMVLSAMSYLRDANGNGQPYQFVVRDPWPRPGQSARRLLTAQEQANAQFLAGVVIEPA